MQAATPSERRSVAPFVRRHDARVSSLPGGSLAPDGEWRGRLTPAHWSASSAAQLACLSPERAARYWPLDLRDRIDLPPALHPEDLHVFVHEWSARLVRSPKDWDGLNGIEAMFDWVRDGLVPPPLDHGAVLLLGAWLPSARGGGWLLSYLEARPTLIGTTLAAVFDVDGVPGASLAQCDQTMAWQSRRMDRHVIPELVRRGHWSRDFVLDGIERALQRGQTGYHTRWFVGLRDVVMRMRVR